VEAPNMNSIMERFFTTVRREALDSILLRGRDQIQHKLKEYVAFTNTQRPQPGIHQQIPKPAEAQRMAGSICKTALLGGLHHHYFKQAAGRAE
jgi:hypothetical protein